MKHEHVNPPRPLINSQIVDKFVRAIESYSDGNESVRSCYRYALEQVAEDIAANAATTK